MKTLIKIEKVGLFILIFLILAGIAPTVNAYNTIEVNPGESIQDARTQCELISNDITNV